MVPETNHSTSGGSSVILRRSYATTSGAVCPPERLGYRSGAGPYPAAPRPSRGILAALLGRTVLYVGRRAPVRLLRACAALRPSPRAAWSPPFHGGPARRRAPPGFLPTRSQMALTIPVRTPLLGCSQALVKRLIGSWYSNW